MTFDHRSLDPHTGSLRAPGVRVGPVQDLRLRWFPVFAAEYATWRATSGGLGDEVFPAERAQLQECLESGAAVCVWEVGSWRGVAAARREDERDIAGYGVVEEFLAGAARGKGYAKLLQQVLIAALDDVGASHLWGSVHARTRAVVGDRTVRRSWHP